MTSPNICNELPFASNPLLKMSQYLKGDFMGDGKEDFLKWCRRFEVTVAAPNFVENSLANLLPTRLGAAPFSYGTVCPMM